MYPLAHSLWGAAWSLVLGFSFATLRLSTLALSLVATWALYLILRELEARPRRASRRLDRRGESCRSLAVILVHDRRALCRLDAAGLLCYTRAMRRSQIHLGLVGEPGRAWRFSIDKSLL